MIELGSKPNFVSRNVYWLILILNTKSNREHHYWLPSNTFCCFFWSPFILTFSSWPQGEVRSPGHHDEKIDTCPRSFLTPMIHFQVAIQTLELGLLIYLFTPIGMSHSKTSCKIRLWLTHCHFLSYFPCFSVECRLIQISLNRAL